MHIIKLIFFLLLSLYFLSFTASASPSKFDRKFWLSQDGRYVVTVNLSKDTLCGKIYWMADDVPPLDFKNPDPAQREKPLCGMNILKGFRQVDDSDWDDGFIYRPKTGSTYHASIRALPTGKAELHGYVVLPIFGQNEILTPASPRKYKKCHAPA